MTKTFVVYAIRHHRTDYAYFGCTGLSPKRRWELHRADLRGGHHACKPLQVAWDLCNESEFIFERLGRFPTKKEGMQYEKSLINRPEGRVFNVIKNGWSPVSSEERSARNRQQWSDPEYKAKVSAAISKAKMGKSRGPHSFETHAKIANANRARGKLQADATRTLITNLLKKHGSMTGKAIAKMLGISEASVSLYLRGLR